MVEFKIFKDVNINKLELHPKSQYDSNDYHNHLDSFDKILTKENFKRLSDFKFSKEDYVQIIKNIDLTSSKILNKTINDNLIDIEGITPFEKVLLYSKSFTHVEFKSSGSSQGVYEYNNIRFEERDCDSQQISTLIHELSHHLLFEIFRQSLMKALDTQTSDDLEFFTAFTLGMGQNIIMDEYCAHTVQGRFIPRDFQEYGSFENIINELGLKDNVKIVSYYSLAGNSFAGDIKRIMEKFIDYDLRQEIKQQFKEDIALLSKSNGYINEFDEVLSIEDKLNFILSTFKNSFKFAAEHKETLNKLKIT